LGLHAALRLSRELCALDKAGEQGGPHLLDGLGLPARWRARGTGVRAGRGQEAGTDGVGYVLLNAVGAPAQYVHGPGAGGGRMADARLNTLWLLHGVNLDMLGTRDPAHYRHARPSRSSTYVGERAALHGFTLRFHTNHEGDMVEQLHEIARDGAAGVGAQVNPAPGPATATPSGRTGARHGAGR